VWAAVWTLYAKTQHVVTVVHGIYSQLQASACHTESHCNIHCLSSHPTPYNAHGLVLKNSEKCDHHFSCSWLRSELLFDTECQMFQCHSLVFALQLIMVDTCFVTSDNVIKKGVIFHMILAQKVVTDVQMVMSIYFVSCFGTHLTETLWK
jgi:hypothetical protein